MTITDTEEYRRGVEFERALAKWLVQNGYLVARVREDSAYAPMLEALGDGVIAPDLYVTSFARMGPCWIEAKWKQMAPVYRVAGVRTTGVDKPNFHDYERAQERSGLPVVIVFGHHAENEVRWARLHEHRAPSVGAGGGMEYWLYDDLPVLCSLDAVREARAATVVFPPLAVQGHLFDMPRPRTVGGYS